MCVCNNDNIQGMIGSLHPGYVVLLQPQLASEQCLHEPCTLQPLVQTFQSKDTCNSYSCVICETNSMLSKGSVFKYVYTAMYIPLTESIWHNRLQIIGGRLSDFWQSSPYSTVTSGFSPNPCTLLPWRVQYQFGVDKSL